MAFTFNQITAVVNLETGTTATSQVFSAAAGSLLVVCIASDNQGTTDAAGTDCVTGVTDTAGNTYTYAYGYRNGQAAAQGGALAVIYYSVLTNAITNGTITVTHSTSAYSRIATIMNFPIGAGSTISVVGTAGGAGDAGVDPVATISGLAAGTEYLWAGAAADETTALIGTASGFTASTGAATSGGAAATNMSGKGFYVIDTGQTGKTFTPATAGDAASVLVAFKENLASVADAWNANDKSTQVTLSNSDKTATNSVASAAGVRSTKIYTKGVAGKYYVEFVNNVTNTSNGWGLKINSGAQNASTSSFYIAGTGPIWVAGVSTGVSLSPLANGDIYSLAWDAGASIGWFRKNGGNWNNSATANPATGTEGIDLSALPAGDYAAWGLFGLAIGPQTTIRTRTAEFTYQGPSGFTSWMGEIIPTTDAWNINDKSASITLSNNDKTATVATAAVGGVHSTTSVLTGSAGKFYAEVLNNSNLNTSVGVQWASGDEATTMPSGYLVGLTSGGMSLDNGQSAGNLGSAVASGDTLCVAFDTATKKLWFRKNSELWNNVVGDDPATGSGGIQTTFRPVPFRFASGCFSTVGASVTVCTKIAEFTKGAPAGFSSWMGEPNPSVNTLVASPGLTTSIGSLIWPIANAWNAADKVAAVTLTNSDRTATNTGGIGGATRSTTRRTNGTAGKYYAEWQVHAVTAAVSFGIKSATASLTTTSDTAANASTTGIIYLNSVQIGTLSTTLVANDIMCMAWDAGAERIWFRKNAGFWNNDAAADPATGTNGLDISTFANVAFCLWATMQNSADSHTIRTELAQFTQTVPNGFASWMGELVTTDGWNILDKSAGITLSNNNKTFTLPAAGSAAVRSTTVYTHGSAGKYYVEFLYNKASSSCRLGILSKSVAIGSSQLSAQVVANSILINNATVGSMSRFPINGDVVCMAWDAGAKKIWFRYNNTNWNNTAGHDPATDVGGLDTSALAADNHAFWGMTQALDDSVTVRTKLAEYTQAVPTGFLSWMGETPSAADWWNPLDKTASITLSNGDKTASSVLDEICAVRSTKSYDSGTAGKYYAEILCTAPGSDGNLGIRSTSGAIVSAAGFHVTGTGNIVVYGSSVGSLGLITGGTILSIAWDAGAEKAWFRLGSSNWNNTAGHDPATGVGGLDVSAGTGLQAIAYTTGSSGRNVTLRTKLAEYTQTVPSGFKSWFGESTGGVNVNVTVTSPGALTASVGTVTPTGKSSVTVASPGLTTSVGTVTVTTPVAGATVPWTPADIGTDLLVWYDFADAATVIQSGGYLTQWRDKSGNARHGTHSVSTLAINSDGIYIANAVATANSIIQMPSLPSKWFDMAFAGKPNPAGSYRTLMANQAGNHHHVLLETANDKLGTYSPGSPASSQAGLTLEWPSVDGQIYYSGSSPSTIKIGRNGDSLLDETGEALDPDLNPALMNYGVGGTQGFGTAREFVFMAVGQSQDIRDKVSGYLAWKWDGILGVTTHVAALPAGHPYKTAAPTVVGHAWTPADLTTGLTSWLDAADASKLTWSGSNLTQWGDKSPTPSNAVAVSTGPTLTAVNGKGSLRFDNQPLQIAATSYGDFTIFAVYKADPSPAGARTYERIADHSSTFGWWIGRYGLTEQFGGGIKSVVDPYGFHVSLPSGQTQLLSLKRQGGTQYTSGNGGAVTNSGACDATVTGLNPVLIGIEKTPTPTFVSPLYGVLSEFIIWSNALSAADQARAEGYLAWKWGIQASLPAGHEYKAAAPRIGGEPAAVNVNVNVTGVELTVSTNSVTVTGKSNVTVASPALAVSTNNVAATGKANVTVTNPALLSVSTNTATVTGKSNVTVANPALLTVATNTPTVVGKANTPVINPGLLTTSVGNVTVTAAIGGAPWTPIQIPTAHTGWYDAADASTITFSGPNVTQWRDKSPAGRHATATSTGPTQTTVNGLGTLAFDNQPLTTADTTFGDFTIFAVFNPGLSPSGTRNYERLLDHNYLTGWFIGRDALTDNWWSGLRRDTDPFGPKIPITSGVTGLVSAKRAGAVQTFTGNGGAVSDTTACTTDVTTSHPVYIGSESALYSNLVGSISEVLIWNTALSAEDQARVEGYLAHKWGIQANLPPGHAYKSSPPTTGVVAPPDVIVNVGGQSVTVSTNTVTATGKAITSVSNPALLTVATNSVTATGKAATTVANPALLTTSTNSVTVTGKASTQVASPAMTASVGTVTVTAKSNVNVTVASPGLSVSTNYVDVSTPLPIPTYGSSSFTSYAGRPTTTITKPITTAEGHILIAGLFRGGDTGADVIPPSGFTKIGTTTLVTDSGGFNGRLEVFWKRATASEPADYLFDQWMSASTQGVMAAYSGCVVAGNPIDAFSQNSKGFPGVIQTATALSVTTGQANDKLVWLGHNWEGAANLTPPTGMTERIDSLIYISDETIVAPGPTGDRTQEESTVQPWAVYLIALKPFGAGVSQDVNVNVNAPGLTASIGSVTTNTTSNALILAGGSPFALDSIAGLSGWLDASQLLTTFGPGETLYPAGVSPSGPTDPNTFMLGSQLQIAAPGRIANIRYYKPNGANTSRFVAIYTNTGEILASGTTSGETPGWNLFPIPPLAVTAGQIIRVAMGYKGTAVDGGFPYNNVPPVSASPNLTWLAGIYTTPAASGGDDDYPSNTITPNNYFVDVVFEPEIAFTDGATINAWPNLGTGADPTIFKTGATPLKYNTNVLNGKGVVRFTADGDRVISTSTGIDQDYTLLYITRIRGPSMGRVFSGVYPGRNYLVGYHATGKDSMFDNGWVKAGSPLGPTPDEWIMYGADGASPPHLYAPNFFKNGQLLATHAASQGAGMGGAWTLSGYNETTADETSDADVAELALYNRKLSNTERQLVEGQLAHKWGLQANLSSGHPYKTVAPGDQVPTITASVGTVTVTAGIGVTVNVTSPALTVSTNNASVTGKSNVTVSSPSLAVSINNVSATGKAIVALTNPLSLTVATFTSTVTGKASAAVTNPALLTVATNNVTATGKSNALTTVTPQLTAGIGQVTVAAGVSTLVANPALLSVSTNNVAVGTTTATLVPTTAPAALAVATNTPTVTQGLGVSTQAASPPLAVATNNVIVTTQQKLTLAQPLSLIVSTNTPTITQGLGVSTQTSVTPQLTTAVGNVTVTTQQKLTAGILPAINVATGGVSASAGGSISTSVSSLPITAATNDVTVRADRYIQTAVTGNSVTTATNNVSVTGKANTTLTVTPQLTVGVGQVTVTTKANVTIVNPLSLTASVGIAAASGKATAPVTGIGLTTATSGILSVTGKANVIPASPELAVATGGVTIFAGGNISIPATSPAPLNVSVGTVIVTARITATTEVSSPGLTVAVGNPSTYTKTVITAASPELTISTGDATVNTAGNISTLVSSPAISVSTSAPGISTSSNIPVAAPGITAYTGIPFIRTSQIIRVSSDELTAMSGTVRILAAGAGVDVWDGTEWVNKPSKVWTGAEWIQKTAKQWTGDVWL